MVVAEYVAVHDAIPALVHACARSCWVVGPNCIGLLRPGLGGPSPALGSPGRVGVVSRSGTLALVITDALPHGGVGQSTVVSIVGATVTGRTPAEYVQRFAEDHEAAATVPAPGKPLVALIVGRHVRPGSRFGRVVPWCPGLPTRRRRRRRRWRRPVPPAPAASLVGLVRERLGT